MGRSCAAREESQVGLAGGREGNDAGLGVVRARFLAHHFASHRADVALTEPRRLAAVLSDPLAGQRRAHDANRAVRRRDGADARIVGLGERKDVRHVGSVLLRPCPLYGLQRDYRLRRGAIRKGRQMRCLNARGSPDTISLRSEGGFSGERFNATTVFLRFQWVETSESRWHEYPVFRRPLPCLWSRNETE